MNIEIKANDKRLLVDGEFTNDTVVHSVRLWCAGSVITGKPQTIVSGAKISVTDNTDTFYYIENKDTLGLYETDGRAGGIGGHNYTLSITNIDINDDGTMDSYTANSMMPVPVRFDSMKSYNGVNGDNIEGTVINKGYYTTFYNGPDYLFDYVIVNSKNYITLTDQLGNGTLISQDLLKTTKVNTPGLKATGFTYFSIEPKLVNLQNGDTITIVDFNFNQDQYEFLKEFDSNTSNNDEFNSQNIYDQLKIPANLPTNIEPSDKAAGYFFIYSISKISKVFIEKIQ